MAHINNQAVIQKLIDELRLYPSSDLVPTELAEKILPTYQINDTAITMTTTPANIVRNYEFAGLNPGANQTLYTTPTTGKFYLTNTYLNYMIDVGFGATGTMAIQVSIDGTYRTIIGTEVLFDTAGNHDSIVMNLQNPILVDAGTNIIVEIDNSLADGNMCFSSGIVGYTKAD